MGGGVASNNSRASAAYMLATHELCARGRSAPFFLLSKRVLKYLVARNHLAARKSNCFGRHWVLFHL